MVICRDMAPQHLEAATAIQTEQVICEHGFFGIYGRFYSSAFGRRLSDRGKRLMHRTYQCGQLINSNTVIGHMIGNDFSR